VSRILLIKEKVTRDLALASMARDDAPASSKASSTAHKHKREMYMYILHLVLKSKAIWPVAVCSRSTHIAMEPVGQYHMIIITII